jgi:hypothetical protein
MLSSGSEFRILGNNTEFDVDGLEELDERGINAIWTVAPV